MKKEKWGFNFLKQRFSFNPIKKNIIKSRFTSNEVTVLLKCMFVILSDDFRVAKRDTEFLKEIAGLGQDFHLIDFNNYIENWETEYNSGPELFLKKLFQNLSNRKLGCKTKQFLLSSVAMLLEQVGRTYHRIIILKCIRATLNLSQSEVPEDYEQYQIPLPFGPVEKYLQRDIISDSLFLRILNEPNEVSR